MAEPQVMSAGEAQVRQKGWPIVRGQGRRDGGTGGRALEDVWGCGRLGPPCWADAASMALVSYSEPGC